MFCIREVKSAVGVLKKKQKNQGKPSGTSVARRVFFLVLSVWYKGLKVRLQFSSLQRGPMFP